MKQTQTHTAMIKTKKISAGFYKGQYKNIEFKIVKQVLPSNEVVWYYQIGNEQVHDWYNSKSQAIEALKYWVDEYINKN